MQQQHQPEQPPVVAAQPGSTPASPGVADQSLEGGSSAPVVLDAVGHGTPEATAASVEHAEAGAHHESFLGLDSYGWVAGSFVVFVLVLIYLKVPKAVASMLDARSERIRAELDAAKRLRADAENLLADYQGKQRQAAGDVEAILSAARAEAERIIADARSQADAVVARRTRMAEDKIAAAERAAEADLRARAATLATRAAAQVIAEQTGPEDQARLTEQAIAELDRRLH